MGDALACLRCSVAQPFLAVWFRQRSLAKNHTGRNACATGGRSEMPDTLIRNGAVITATSTTSADVLISGDKIKEVRPGIPPNGATVLDASGMYVIPGGVDVHTHLDMP